MSISLDSNELHFTLGLCLANWTYFAHSNKCYKKSDDQPQDIEVARRSCKSLGGELASIPDEETNNFIATQFTSKGLWIGGQK